MVADSFGYSCTPGSWVSYVEAFNNSLNGPYFAHYAELSGVNQGDGVNFSIYYDEQGNELHFVITPPSTSRAGGVLQDAGLRRDLPVTPSGG